MRPILVVYTKPNNHQQSSAPSPHSRLRRQEALEKEDNQVLAIFGVNGKKVSRLNE